MRAAPFPLAFVVAAFVAPLAGACSLLDRGPGAAEGEGGEGEGSVGEGEGSVGEGEGSVGEGEGEGTAGAPTLDDALATLRAGDAGAALSAFTRSDGLPLVLADGRTLFVTTGALRQFAGDVDNWVPEAMTDEGAFAWIVKDAPRGGGYKFTDGTTFVADPLSRAYTYDGFGELSLTSRRPEGVIGGRERHFGVGGFGLAERTVRVLVPASDVTHVMYAHDGQNLWDAASAFGGQTWRIDEVLPPSVLVVGIDNTSARVDEYTPVVEDGIGGGRSADYDRLLEEVVRPLVRRWYGEPGPVGVMGSSLGGLVSFDIADRNPDAYDFAASLSGTFGWGSFTTDHDDTMIDRYTGAGHRHPVMYLDSGGTASGCADLDHDGINDDVNAGDNSCETVQMRGVLQSDGYVEGQDLFYVFQEGAQHNEAAWATRVGNVLAIFAAL